MILRRMKFAIILILAEFVFSGCKGIESNPQTLPVAQKGIIDLSNWDIEKNPAIGLDGEWEFYWQEFLDPVATKVTSNPVYIPVPSQWQTKGYPVYGFASYRLQILLPADCPPLSFAMTNAATAYTMYINGQEVSRNGTVAKSPEGAEPLLKHGRFSLENRGKILNLIIHVSNFHFIQAGLWNTIRIGKTTEIERVAKQKFVVDLIVFSSLITMALYHLGLFLNRRKDPTPFYFGAFCGLMALRTVCLNERVIMDAIPAISFLIVHKIEFVSFSFGGVLFTQYIQSLFPLEFSKWISRAMRFVFISSTLTVILFPMSIYGHALLPVQLTVLFGILYFIYVLVRALLRSRNGARLFLVGFIIFASTLVFDIMKTLGYFYGTIYMSSYGFLTFIVFQATILSRKFGIAFTESEMFAAELKVLSAGLEEKVKQRTEELNKTLHVIRQDLSVAKTVQEHTLAIDPNLAPELKIVTRYLPISEVGGDFYAVSRVNEFTYRIFLADATGHGVQAALITMAIKGIYDSIKNSEMETAKIFEIFNNRFIEQYSTLKSYLTACLVDIDIKKQKLYFSSAGHPAQIVISGGEARTLEKTGKMFGIKADTVYESREAEFKKGDRLYLFTDGLFEEFNASKEEFGEKRVHAFLSDSGTLELAESVSGVIKRLELFLDGTRQDDVTVIGVEYSG